jgi:hypothetical protein
MDQEWKSEHVKQTIFYFFSCDLHLLSLHMLCCAI